MDIVELYQLYKDNPVICTDTRKITQGCLFFALKGENFNGNAFAQTALQQGASFAVIDEVLYKQDPRTILFDDVLQTLQNLAKHHRRQLNIPIIGITGSNGKTTTKELIRAVLAVKYRTSATVGNLNNHIGVPLTVLAIGPEIEIAIVEMGANHQREIAELCAIADPRFGVITNVGKAHLEGFGGFEGVKKGKGELYDHLKSVNGKAFINQDNLHLREMAEARNLENVNWLSTSSDSAIKAEIIENDPFLLIDWIFEGKRHRVQTHLTGPYNLENILVAIAMGKEFGLTDEEINTGLESYVPGNNRSQILKTQKNTLICDYYNANPSSMTVALENFAAISADKKVLIIGDMFELGEESVVEHCNIIERAEALDQVEKIFVGHNFKLAKSDQSQSMFFESTAEVETFLKSHPLSNATVLIKGSRGMQLEKLVALL